MSYGRIYTNTAYGHYATDARSIACAVTCIIEEEQLHALPSLIAIFPGYA